MKNQRRKFSEEFKVKVLHEVVLNEKAVAAIARKFDLEMKKMKWNEVEWSEMKWNEKTRITKDKRQKTKSRHIYAHTTHHTLKLNLHTSHSNWIYTHA